MNSKIDEKARESIVSNLMSSKKNRERLLESVMVPLRTRRNYRSKLRTVFCSNNIVEDECSFSIRKKFNEKILIKWDRIEVSKKEGTTDKNFKSLMDFFCDSIVEEENAMFFNIIRNLPEYLFYHHKKKTNKISLSDERFKYKIKEAINTLEVEEDTVRLFLNSQSYAKLLKSNIKSEMKRC